LEPDAPAAAPPQPADPTPPPPPGPPDLDVIDRVALHRGRRERLGRALGPDAVAVVPAGPLVPRSHDTEFRFRPASEFHWLCGRAEPDAVLVLRPGRQPESVVFVRPRDPVAETWTGRRLGPAAAVGAYGVDAAFALDALEAELPALIDGARELHVPLLPTGSSAAQDLLTGPLGRALQGLRRRERTGARPPTRLADLGDALGELRLRKDAGALRSLRRAVDITVDAHLAALADVRPGMGEWEVEARLEYEFRRRGASGPAYGSIVGTGANATILHYVDNGAVLRPGELLLVDAGAEWDLHAGDLTRTVPVDGRFRPAQRALYDVVLRANQAGIALARPGSSIDAIHQRCLEVLCEGLIDMGLIEGPIADAIAEERYRDYYMHRTSHWLGADVHDAGRYFADGSSRPLEPGFVLTIEPGLYVASDAERAPHELRGVGIRIEDDVLITADGHEVLTARAPKAVDEVEAWIRGGQAP
jgi:Xaa-Pro aminopeptidase